MPDHVRDPPDDLTVRVMDKYNVIVAFFDFNGKRWARYDRDLYSTLINQLSNKDCNPFLGFLVVFTTPMKTTTE